jgi:hypothetical protein
VKEPGHWAGAYLLSRLILKQIDLPEAERNQLLLAGTVAGALPDLDILAYVLWRRSLDIPDDFDHHKWISHTAPPYLAAGYALYRYAKRRGSPKLATGAILITGAALLHLLLDMIGSGTGLMWAWPLSRRMDGIYTLHVTGKAWTRAYDKHPISWVERILVGVAVLTFLLARRRTPGALDMAEGIADGN